MGYGPLVRVAQLDRARDFYTQKAISGLWVRVPSRMAVFTIHRLKMYYF